MTGEASGQLARAESDLQADANRLLGMAADQREHGFDAAARVLEEIADRMRDIGSALGDLRRSELEDTTPGSPADFGP